MGGGGGGEGHGDSHLREEEALKEARPGGFHSQSSPDPEGAASEEKPARAGAVPGPRGRGAWKVAGRVDKEQAGDRGEALWLLSSADPWGEEALPKSRPPNATSPCALLLWQSSKFNKQPTAATKSENIFLTLREGPNG